MTSTNELHTSASTEKLTAETRSLRSILSGEVGGDQASIHVVENGDVNHTPVKSPSLRDDHDDDTSSEIVRVEQAAEAEEEAERRKGALKRLAKTVKVFKVSYLK